MHIHTKFANYQTSMVSTLGLDTAVDTRANYNSFDLICQVTGQQSVRTDIEKVTGPKCMVHVIRHIMFIYTNYVAIVLNSL